MSNPEYIVDETTQQNLELLRALIDEAIDPDTPFVRLWGRDLYQEADLTENIEVRKDKDCYAIDIDPFPGTVVPAEERAEDEHPDTVSEMLEFTADNRVLKAVLEVEGSKGGTFERRITQQRLSSFVGSMVVQVETKLHAAE